jgi:Hr1 repeat
MTATMLSEDDPSSSDRHLQSLEKQLTIEMKVKNGTENMIQSISQNYQSRDKKLLAEAYTMLDDSKAKIEFLKLKILKVKQNRQTGRVSFYYGCQLRRAANFNE